MSINNRGHLEIGGCDIVELAEKYGAPFYILDEETVINKVREYQKAFAALPNSEIIYASKAFLTVGFAKLLANLDLSMDVVSGGELYIALEAGFPTEKIYFHGNNKSLVELQEALAANVGRIVVDNLQELDLLSTLAVNMNKEAQILLRLTPGVEAHTHSYIQTGQLDSKFGIGLANGQALDVIKYAASLPNIQLMGIHCHIGSQIFDLSSYEVAIDLMLKVFVEAEAAGIKLTELDLGGGLGIKHTPLEPLISIEEYGSVVTKAVTKAANLYGLPIPKIMVEPGRSIVGEAGTTVYSIGSIKEIEGIRTYAAVDGGMGDNPRVALYQAQYHAIVANKANEKPTSVYTVAGKYCESGDILLNDIKLPQLEPNDILVVLATGAYNYSMSSNYNSIPRLPVITVYQGNSDILVERETYQDLVRLQKIPTRWQLWQSAKEADKYVP